eukprot:11959117-Ditylum_brightwellii.AAC.1
MSSPLNSPDNLPYHQRLKWCPVSRSSGWQCPCNIPQGALFYEHELGTVVITYLGKVKQCQVTPEEQLSKCFSPKNSPSDISGFSDHH